MRRTAFAGLIVLAGLSLAGCLSSPPPAPGEHARYALTQAEVLQVERDLRRSFRNPDALFSVMKAARSPSGSLVVCGWANLRDDLREFIRYVGHRPFAVEYRLGPTGLRNFRVVRFAMVKSEAPPVYLYCSARGVAL